MPSRRGKLIVIDGSDGSGKATQTELLVKRLRREGRKVKTLDFPQYHGNLFGALIAECLRGEHGNFPELDPKIASTLYAADRFESKQKLERWLAAGNIVILDRYVSANQMHQGGKIRDARARAKFLQWLDDVEFGVFKIPRPDVIVYLSVPVAVSLELLKNKDQGKKKQYTQGRGDVVENDIRYLEASRRGAEAIVQKLNDWRRIECTDKKGTMRSRETIHEDVYSIVKRYV